MGVECRQRGGADELAGRAEQFTIDGTGQTKREKVDNHAHDNLVCAPANYEQGKQQRQQQSGQRAAQNADIRIVQGHMAEGIVWIQGSQCGGKSSDKHQSL